MAELEGRTAIVYGGGGALGSGVAQAFAREGAKVFLAGRSREPIEAVAAEITAAGGYAEAAVALLAAAWLIGRGDA